MSEAFPLLLTALRAPASMSRLDLAEWDSLLRQAERCDMGAILSGLAREHKLLDALPRPVRKQFDWIDVRARRHRQGVEWEVRQLAPVFKQAGLPLVLLKGAAYALADLPAASGRLFSDIDILVPFEQLGQVEGALMLDGWVSSTPDAYDQRYYREWMHELPPMQHVKRQTVLDVHHAILPRTASAKPDSRKLLNAAQEIPRHPGLRMLAPVDIVLHSAVHLFHEGEFDHGLRGLFDLHRLLGDFNATPGFWDALPRRASELDVSRSLFYALRYTTRVFGTAVPAHVLDTAAAASPGMIQLALMDRLFERVLRPSNPVRGDWFGSVARFALYIRGNWLRMPPMMLARHLFHKAFLSKTAA